MHSLLNLDQNSILASYFHDCGPKTYIKGDVIIQGEAHYGFVHYIVSGYVKGYTISDDGSCSLLSLKSSTDLIPLSILFSNEQEPVYYEAMTDVVLQTLPRDEFEKALSVSRGLSMAVLKKALVLLRDNTDRLRNLTIMDAHKRIIARILYLLDRFGAASLAGREVIFVPITYPDLADSLNLTRETANRIVRQLVGEGLVNKSRGHIIVTDKDRLIQEVSGL